MGYSHLMNVYTSVFVYFVFVIVAFGAFNEMSGVKSSLFYLVTMLMAVLWPVTMAVVLVMSFVHAMYELGKTLGKDLK